MNKYNAAPLPFQGQKRGFVKEFRAKLKEFPDDIIFLDLFGGSGLLSHIVKCEKPNAIVVWNDYDHFQQRLENINKTNKLIGKIKELIITTTKEKRLTKRESDKVIQIIEKERGFVDYITLSSNLLFSGKYANSIRELTSHGFYNKITSKPYNADGYLKGVIRENGDYREVLKKYECSRLVVIADPPYLSTDISSYSKDKYWLLTDYLEVLNNISKHPYFFFSSSKSSLLELMQWIDKHHWGAYLSCTEVIKKERNIGNNRSYTDIMIYKKEL